MAKSKAPTNSNELREFGCEVLAELRNKELHANIGKEIYNGMGKVINSVKMELEYAHITKQAPNIPFLAYDKGAAK